MNHKEIRTLKLLEAVETGRRTSQRSLARHLDISLGLVNASFRRLVHEGYFKVNSGLQGNSQYSLTPEGAEEKSRLTFEYFRLSSALYKETKEKLLHMFRALEKERVKNIVFYGVGEFAEMAYLTLRKTDLHLISIVDEEKAGELFFEWIVKTPDCLDTLDFDRILMTDVENEPQAINRALVGRGFSGRAMTIPYLALSGEI